MAIVPFPGSTARLAVTLLVLGGLNGFANVITITAFQRWAPPDWLGRLMGILLFASFGMFPVSVVLAGVIVHRFGPAPFFVVSAAVLAVAVLAGLTQPSVAAVRRHRRVRRDAAGGPATARRSSGGSRAGTAQDASRHRGACGPQPSRLFGALSRSRQRPGANAAGHDVSERDL